MLRDADKIVCLTSRARSVLKEWYFHDQPDGANDKFQVIPCCADFEHFDPARISSLDIDRARAVAGLQRDDFVFLYLGSLGPDYLLPAMMATFLRLCELKANARFLFVSNNGRELVDTERKKMRVPEHRVRFVSVTREEVPAFICLANISVVFIRADISKAGCSPTKLGELFACNVPVIANSGVGDMDSILSLEKNGSSIVYDFKDQTLDTALASVIAAAELGIRIRDNSRSELSLEAGEAKYAAVYDQLLDTQGGVAEGETC